jgi:tRNA-splicing ligase RtcB
LTTTDLAPVESWLTEPLSDEVAQSVERMRRAEDVCRVALMPDVHLAKDVCVGAVVATKQLIYPAAVGSDIGCGMAALAFDAEATLIDKERPAAQILAGLYERVPSNKHPKPRELPASLQDRSLSEPRLQKTAERDGRVQLGTLGRGNHFLDLQADQAGRLWVMIHSGSRAVGQAISEHSLKHARGRGLVSLESGAQAGHAYLNDAEWARTYARENRLAMLCAVEQLLQVLFRIEADWKTLIHCDHNHVSRETLDGICYWIHRKGAQSAAADEAGVIPGSMGSISFHTAGRGCSDSLLSCSHGAGRQLSRTEARQRVSLASLTKQMGQVWFDHRRAEKLRDEAPAAYKDIRQVMRAQRELVRIERELRPLLSYKGV